MDSLTKTALNYISSKTQLVNMANRLAIAINKGYDLSDMRLNDRTDLGLKGLPYYMKQNLEYLYTQELMRGTYDENSKFPRTFV